jgi:hypothetical protein
MRENSIGKLKVDESVVSSHNDIENVLFEHYKDILGIPVERNNTLNMDVIEMNHADLSLLEACFPEEEIWDPIKEMPSEKAPGPDSLTIAFYQKSWQIIKGSYGSLQLFI